MQSTYLHFKHPNILHTSDELSRSNFYRPRVCQQRLNRNASTPNGRLKRQCLIYCFNSIKTLKYSEYIICDTDKIDKNSNDDHIRTVKGSLYALKLWYMVELETDTRVLLMVPWYPFKSSIIIMEAHSF